MLLQCTVKHTETDANGVVTNKLDNIVFLNIT